MTDSKAKLSTNISNGMVSGIPIPASFCAMAGDANVVVMIRDGGTGVPFVKYNKTTFNGERAFFEFHVPIYCANGIHANISGGNAIITYI